MPYIEVLFGLAVAIAGVAIATVASGMGYVSGGVPGAGFFPFWVGLLLIVAGLALAVATWRRPSKTERVESGQLVSIAAGGAFLAVMAFAGAIVATVTYLFATVWMTRRHGILVTIATAVIATAVTYLTFQTWLLIPLPRGWLFH